MQFSTLLMPTLPSLHLSESEKAAITLLYRESLRCRAEMELAEAYYLGTQVVQNLRIAVPKELEFLNAVLGWPAMAVDPYVSRLNADCFRVPTATDGDQTISDIMTANGFAAEQSLAFKDTLMMGRGFWSAGSAVTKDDAPVISVESPINTAVLWDLRGKQPKSALQFYWEGGRAHAALLVPFKTVHLVLDDDGQWKITDRDDHGFDFVPLVRMAHEATSRNRDGRSAITPAMRYYTAAAARTLLGLEVAREIYSVPQKILLGASESDFMKSDGTPKTAWETYITSVLAIERDDEGNVPDLKQSQPYDPAVFTKLLDWYASAMAGAVLSPPQNMGLYTQGNPASAESVVAMNAERDLNAVQMQNQFGVPLVQVAQMALRFMNKGVLPAEFKTLAVDWNPVTLPTPGITSDAITKQIAAGSIPATSDVTLKRLGYSSVERRRLEQDRKLEAGRQTGRMIAESLLNSGRPTAPAETPPQPGQPSGNPAGL